MMTAREIGRIVGAAMARDEMAEGRYSEWTGLDAQDGDKLALAGLTPDTPEWADAEATARNEYEYLIACRKPLAR